MKNQPLLSICIPTYNRNEQVKTMLDSIISQKEFTDTYDIEILINECPSNNECEGLVKKYIKKFGDKIKYIKNKKKLGGCPAFLNALNLGIGQYLRLMSDDELMCDDALKLILSTIKNNNPKIIITCAGTIYDKKNIINFNNFADFLNYFSVLKSTTFFDKDYLFSHLCCCIIKKEHFLNNYSFLINNNILTENQLKHNYFNFNFINFSNLGYGQKISFIEQSIIDTNHSSGGKSFWNMNYKIYKDMNLLTNYINNNYALSKNSQRLLSKISFSRLMLRIITPFKENLNRIGLGKYYVNLAKHFRNILKL